jgi:hypothetical protein
MGGEPFLHKDLHGFISALKNKFSQGIALSTNCFWLSERNIEYYRSLFNMLSLLNITIYPPFIEKFGGIDSIQNHLDRIRFNHPDMSLVVRHATSFYVLEYTDTPLVVDKYCGAADCTCLLPDGRLARCGPGAFAHLTPHATKQFLLGRDDLFYDLKKNPGDFWMWRRRWPLNACQFCTHFTHKTKPWQPVSTATKRNII